MREPFDHLVYAAGAVPAKPPWTRTDAGGVFGVQTLDDGAALHAWLESSPAPSRAVVVGGGYIGVEMAEAMINRGLSVTLVEQAAQPMSTVDPDMGAMVAEALSGMGVDIRTGTSVTGLEQKDGRVSAVVTEAGTVPADIVVLGLGVRPNTALADAAGLPLGTTGGIRVDLRMRVVGVEGVWAAGDCVETIHRVSGRPVHVAARHARQQAGPGRRDQPRRRVRDVPGRRSARR